MRYQLCESLSLIVSQRLIRTLCPGCKCEVQSNSEDRALFQARLRMLGETGHSLPAAYFAPAPNGCDACQASGYAGHIPINGVLPFARDVKDAAIRLATQGDLQARQHITASRAQTLFASALGRLRDGVCGLHDVLYF